MLDNWITGEHRFILVIDKLGQDRIAYKIVSELLRAGGSVDHNAIIQQPPPVAIGDRTGYDEVLQKCSAAQQQQQGEHKWCVVLPTLGEMLMGEPASFVFRYIQRLLTMERVQHVVLWATYSTLLCEDRKFIMKCCQHMAHATITMHARDALALTTRRRFGKVLNKTLQCVRSDSKFEVIIPKDSPEKGNGKANATVDDPEELKPASAGPAEATFKIDLEEDEMVARNALKLPYERTKEEVSKVVYTPDANDDMDDSEPEEET